MNKVILVGRLTKDPEVRYSGGENTLAVARYTIAVERRFKRDGEPTADFIPCVVFGRSAEFAEKYFRQGMRVSVSGRIQTGSYTNKDGMKVYTTDVIVEEQEFAESRTEREANRGVHQQAATKEAPSRSLSGSANTLPRGSRGVSISSRAELYAFFGKRTVSGIFTPSFMEAVEKPCHCEASAAHWLLYPLWKFGF